VKRFVSARGLIPWYQHSGVRNFTVLAFVLAGITLTVAPLRAQGAEERLPFNASYDGRINLMPTLDPAFVVQEAVAFGRATFLPNSTAFFTHWLDATAVTDAAVLGSFALTGADANEIDGDYEAVVTAPDESGNSFISGRYTLTGGLGKFVEAAGSGTISGVINVLTGTYSVSLDGDITPPPAPVPVPVPES
jgi:hypothetical protein